jgi:site-specific recombinase XerD
VFLRWCDQADADVLAARRVDIELFVRWLQEVRRFRPSTVSRRLSAVVAFYRTRVIDAVLDHSPAEYVRRPTVPAESPTLGRSHLQFEAMLTAARLSDNPFDFALVAMVPLPPAVGRANDRAVSERTAGPILLNRAGTRMDRHAATRRLKHLAKSAGIRMPRMHPHMLRHTFVTTMLDAGVPLRDVQIAARHADPRTTMRYDRDPQKP